MDSMGLTRYMSVLMDDAMKQARFFDHEFVMPEHMLLSLLRQYAFCQALQEEGVDSIKMHEDLVGWLAKQERVPENIKFLPEPSSLFKTMFGTACALAAAADRKLVNVPHFVQAMFGLQNSEAAFLLCKNVGDRQGEFLASVDSYYPLENEPGDETLLMGDGYDEDDYDNDMMKTKRRAEADSLRIGISWLPASLIRWRSTIRSSDENRSWIEPSRCSAVPKRIIRFISVNRV